MSEEALKLTTYFGERSRVRGRLLADELLDVHTRHGIRSSILLRGIQGFGAKHRRRSDRLLTLSEDLPLVSLAVDTSERVEALARDMSAIGPEGLITLERARLCSARIESGDLAEVAGETVKLTVYLPRHARVDGAPAFAAACRTLHDSGVVGATVLLGVDGTADGRRQRARFFARNTHVPLMVMSVGNTDQISNAVARLQQLLSEPLCTIERVRVCKRDGALLQPPTPLGVSQQQPEPSVDLRQKLTIITSEAARHESRSAYLELVRRLRTANVAGATSLRGIWGFHGDHAPHGDRLLALRRHVPIVTVAVDTQERIASLFPIIDEMTRERGLVTSELIPATSALHASHDELIAGLSNPPT
jgi:PII-like signaling protein